MSIREQIQERDKAWLAPWACRQTRGREKPISPDDLRTEFQRDRDRIIHSKAFRRLKFKTQCFSTNDDEFRTRLTHTLEVAQIARTLARALRLNEDLAEAIALGHDLGHTPFGHMGERTLNRLMPEGFRHREQSLRVVDVLENQGEGLNLTWEVRDGIAHHSGSVAPSTLEGQCVSRADRIAYINHDIDDALRAGVLSRDDLPRDLTRVLGASHGERIDTMIRDIIRQSADGAGVRMSEEVGQATLAMRTFLFERVYHRHSAREEERKISRLIEALYDHVLRHPEVMPADYLARSRTQGLERSAGDFVASMTDHYAIQYFESLFLPAYQPAEDLRAPSNGTIL